MFRLPGLNRNVRTELKKGKKVYFYDCGIRNAILNSFKPMTERTDAGALWENFVIAERMKYLKYSGLDALHYFWRTTQQQEIDLIEELDEQMNAYEIKWNARKTNRFPLTFTENYPNATTHFITRANIEEYITK